MDENRLKAIVEEVVNKAVEPITRRLDDIEEQLTDPDTGLKRLNDRMDTFEGSLNANTAAVVKLESTVNGYGDMYKINDSNIRKIEKRLEVVEEKDSINVPPELQRAERRFSPGISTQVNTMILVG